MARLAAINGKSQLISSENQWFQNLDSSYYMAILVLYATFMKSLIIIIFCLTLVACNNSNLQTENAIPKSIHIPDTTNNWYAKVFDYPYYLKKNEVTKELNLENLEADTSNSEIRIWTIGSNYNAQTVISLKNKNNIWTISRLNYYLSFDNAKTKVDSVAAKDKIERTISTDEITSLRTEQIWQLPSQSEMKNGGSYGCVDGYGLLIEMNSKTKYKFSFYMCPDFHVSKDTTFQNVINFKQKVGELLSKNN